MLRYSLLILHVIISINLVTVNCDQNTDLSVPSISQTHTKSGKQSDCKYMKGTWSACSNGIRSREDTLRVSHSVSNCNNTRTIHKKCKNVCRYNKGPWSDCVNGEKSRTDTLKIPTPGCEATRPATKKCRPACRYSKGEWTPCENGEKKRTLTRLEGDGPDCPATKAVSKQCSPQAKKTKQPRNKNRKTNSSSITPSQAY
ncbi:uncharacterized protein LOC107360426 isoform X1 [Tetranychus urticae]|uniref:Pleiotrophin/Midkine C-terminal domain-containing protein n=1 Tax=Tetranychus urticae TaxID=32264 RepID=T1JQ37_TETUR|nr:uncharacterized protein LOC107360426 isoform X1 [Tetranychus urticae]